MLVDQVKDSDALVLFQSRDVLHHPWCLIELDAAITHSVPLVLLSCVGKKYDFVGAVDFLLHLETYLETLNPDALEVLRMNDIDPLRLAHKLHSVVPNLISIPFNASATENAINATMADLVKAVGGAQPLSITASFEEWLARRKETEQQVLEQALDVGAIHGGQRGRMLRKIERAEELAEELRDARALLANKDAEHKAATEKRVADLVEMLEKKDAMIKKFTTKL